MRWRLDCVSDAFTDRRRFRVLAVVDDLSRERLAMVADTSFSGQRVARELDALTRRSGGAGRRVRKSGHGRSETVSRISARPACR